MGIRTAMFSQAALACALLAPATAACSSSSSGTPAASTGDNGDNGAVFVGDVVGTDAKVGIVTGKSKATFYFCGGDTSYATRTHWIPAAAVAGSAIAAGSDASGWSVMGQLGDGGVSGSVVMGDGGSFSFLASSVVAQTIAGLYEATGPCGTLGVIATQASAGDAPSLQGACLPLATGGSTSGEVEQVNPVMPIMRAADGSIAVLVGGTQFQVKQAAAPAE